MVFHRIKNSFSLMIELDEVISFIKKTAEFIISIDFYDKHYGKLYEYYVKLMVHIYVVICHFPHGPHLNILQ